MCETEGNGRKKERLSIYGRQDNIQGLGLEWGKLLSGGNSFELLKIGKNNFYHFLFFKHKNN